MPDCRRRLPVALLTAAATILGIGAFATSAFAANDAKHAKRDHFAFFDSRQTTAARQELRARAARLDSEPSAAVAGLRASLGNEGLVTIDPLTATPRFVGRTDAFLTAPSSASAASIALGYVTAKAAAFGLTASDLASLTLARDYVDILGTHHLSWTQSASGIPAFGNGLQANVTKDGRLINVYGSPVASLAAPSTSPGINAAQAIASAKADAEIAIVPEAATTLDGARQSTTFTSGDAASLVLFQTVGGTRLAWQTYVSADQDSFVHVIDAETGHVLYRRSTLNYANPGHASVWEFYPAAPGVPAAGTQQDVDLTAPGWLAPGATTLTSNNSHVYTDINANNAVDATEEVAPAADGSYSFPFTVFTLPPNPANNNCSAAYPCSWRSQFPQGSFSWQVNRSQNAAQVFYFVNKFHDHLAADPIGFTEAAGNFQNVNSSGQGLGGDAINTEPLDGANTLCCVGGQPVGLPNNQHVDNANMNTPPDGVPPRMQMFLFHYSQNPNDPFVAANGGDEADVIYHEFTHGLSNRLVIDAQGNSTLGGGQAGAMGEAWSDWYAYDFLVNLGIVVDTPADGDLRVGEYVGHGLDLIRTQPLDCPVGSASAKCQAGTRPGRTAGPGGYTYGDYGKIIGFPEVHADGEIWGETLWDLRSALGSQVTEGLVTRAMELSPANPSMLDERNSILQADLVAFGGSHHTTIWQVFAHRGMGWFAGAFDGDDVQPVEDFSTPPPPSPFGKLLGKVVDQDTGKPIEGILVGFGGHASGFTSDLAALTKKNGLYDIKRVPVGTYPKVFASGAGYDRGVRPTVGISADVATEVSWQLRRDWASIFGGASIKSFTGPDYTAFGCGPDKAIDQTGMPIVAV
jgi:extracellular elastinolytic metalloproteinase